MLPCTCCDHKHVFCSKIVKDPPIRQAQGFPKWLGVPVTRCGRQELELIVYFGASAQHVLGAGISFSFRLSPPYPFFFTIHTVMKINYLSS